MAEQARVHAIDEVRGFRIALVKFRDEVGGAISTSNATATRLLDWVARDRVPHWKREIRAREELLARAKSELVRKQADASGDARRTVDERKAVEKAKRRVDEARAKLAASQKWARELEREVDLYRGAVQPLSGVLQAEIPRALERLDRLAGSLEAYIAVEHPDAERDATPQPADAAQPTPLRASDAVARALAALPNPAARSELLSPDHQPAALALPGWRDAKRLWALRLDPAAPHDSGWCLVPAGCDGTAPPESVALDDAETARPGFGAVRSAEVGTAAVLGQEGIERLERFGARLDTTSDERKQSE